MLMNTLPEEHRQHGQILLHLLKNSLWGQMAKNTDDSASFASCALPLLSAWRLGSVLRKTLTLNETDEHPAKVTP